MTMKTGTGNGSNIPNDVIETGTGTGNDISHDDDSKNYEIEML